MGDWKRELFAILPFTLGGILCEVFSICSVLVSFLRFGKDGVEKGGDEVSIVKKWLVPIISIVLALVCAFSALWMLWKNNEALEVEQLAAEAKVKVSELCSDVLAVSYSNEAAYPAACEKLSKANALYTTYLTSDTEVKMLLENTTLHFQSLKENPALNYDREALQTLVEKTLENKAGKWSVYIEIPGTDFYVEHNNRQVIAASTIKLYNMLTLFHKAQSGETELTDSILRTTTQMIQQSSNSASNAVVSYIGGGNFFTGAKEVTEYAKSIGCTETQEQHMLFDVYEYSPGWNLTSVRDCGLVLRKLYMGECVSEAYDARMLEILKGQTRRFKIPQGLPEGTIVANKTGENNDAELDVAIVYAPECDYILCISVTEFNGAAVRGTMAQLSKEVYAFFDNPKSI